MDVTQIKELLSSIDWAEVTVTYVAAATFFAPIFLILFLASLRKRRQLLKLAETEKEKEAAALQKEIDKLRNKYSTIINIEEAIAKENKSLSDVKSELESLKNQ